MIRRNLLLELLERHFAVDLVIPCQKDTADPSLVVQLENVIPVT